MKHDLNNKESNKIRRKYQSVVRIENIKEKKENQIKKMHQDKLNAKWLKDSKD